MENTQADKVSVDQPNPGADMSVRDLLQLENSISILQERPFVGRADTELTTSADAEIQAAKEALPQVHSAYKPSGGTTVLAVFAMILACPFLLVFLVLLCGALCFGYAHLGTFIENGKGGVKGAQLLGLLSVILDAGIMVILCVIPKWVMGGLSKLCHNRNATFGAVLVGLTTLIASILFFAPLIEGESLAPTDIIFLIIPMKWIIIPAGCLLTPYLAAVAIHTKISEQKYCESQQVYLNPTVFFIAFDFAENALELLRREQPLALTSLPRVTTKKPKHAVRVTLWSHEVADTAFLELEALYRAKQPKKDNSTEEKTANWLFYSEQLDSKNAHDMRNALI